jgi:hypothetical protein
MQEINEQDYKSQAAARSGGIFISYRVLAGLILLVVLAVGSAFYISKAGSAKPCEKVYQTEAAAGAEYVQVKRQYISQGWKIEEDKEVEGLYGPKHIIKFSRCR